jgi:hypothetical protein
LSPPKSAARSRGKSVARRATPRGGGGDEAWGMTNRSAGSACPMPPSPVFCVRGRRDLVPKGPKRKPSPAAPDPRSGERPNDFQGIGRKSPRHFPSQTTRDRRIIREMGAKIHRKSFAAKWTGVMHQKGKSTWPKAAQSDAADGSRVGVARGGESKEGPQKRETGRWQKARGGVAWWRTRRCEK